MQFDDDDQPGMVNGLLNGLIDPNDAVDLNTRRAYEQGDTLPTPRGVFHVVAASRPGGEGYLTPAVKVG